MTTWNLRLTDEDQIANRVLICRNDNAFRVMMRAWDHETDARGHEVTRAVMENGGGHGAIVAAVKRNEY